jgi:hypothetical protein
MKASFDNLTFVGTALGEAALLSALPPAYRKLLSAQNGFIACNGGLHIRGLCDDPDRHSLQQVWTGDGALAKLYPSVDEHDIPFGQDCVGDQFLLRDEIVHRLWAETGEMESLGCDFHAFLAQAAADPVAYLTLQPLLQFQAEGGSLQPGQLLSVYPLYERSCQWRLTACDFSVGTNFLASRFRGPDGKGITGFA